MRRWERRLRNWSGLLLAAFVCLHLVNHSLGLISLPAMEQLRTVLAAVWRSVPGTLALYGALILHFALALMSLYRRTTLRMPWWEAAQLGLGLAILPLLSGHIAGTRGGWMVMGRSVDYEGVITALWSDPLLSAKQTLVLVIVWAHMLVGLHFWLRLRRRYRAAVKVLYPIAILVPLLALLGFARVGTQLELAGAEHGYRYGSDYAAGPSAPAATWSLGDMLLLTTLGLIGITLAARRLRVLQRRAGRSYRLHHVGGKTVSAPIGRTILEAVREARIPHASVCGGRARCTTCRVRVGDGLERLPPPGALEQAALQRIEAAPNVRLACQTRPSHDLQITPLLAADTFAGDRRQGGVRGRERAVTALFVDLRGSTRLADTKLPYDVLFILNQFFAEMAAAVEETGGHYAQFNGDGLLALYGLKGGPRRGCRAALSGAVAMTARVDRLNRMLGSELEQPLRIGIGIHHGTAIVGSMGPPQAPLVSAIGDTVNLAARLEALSKDYACTLVVSAPVLHHAGVPLDAFDRRSVQVRGKQEIVDVYTLEALEHVSGLLQPEPPRSHASG